MKKILPYFITLLACSSAQASPAPSEAEISGRNQYYLKPYTTICQLSDTVLETANTPDQAAQLEQILEQPLSYSLKLDNEGKAYIQLAIKEWNEKFVIATNPNIKLTLKSADVTGSNITNLQCREQKLVMHHFNTHEWGSYLLAVSGKPNQLISLRIAKEQ